MRLKRGLARECYAWTKIRLLEFDRIIPARLWLIMANIVFEWGECVFDEG